MPLPRSFSTSHRPRGSLASLRAVFSSPHAPCCHFSIRLGGDSRARTIPITRAPARKPDIHTANAGCVGIVNLIKSRWKASHTAASAPAMPAKSQRFRRSHSLRCPRYFSRARDPARRRILRASKVSRNGAMATLVSSASASHLLRRSVSRSARRDNRVLPRNHKLRAALDTGQPLILFRKEFANYYTPVMPVYVVDDYPEERSFIIALDEAFRFMGDVRDLAEPQRAYALRLAKQRLHQPAFRTRV